MKIPLHYGKQRAELAQAQAELSRARSDREAQSQELAAELREQYVIAEQSAELLKINRQGLIPQTRTGFQAGLAAYQNQRQDFQPLLTSYLDILRLEQENLQTLAEHETAIARVEQITEGLSPQRRRGRSRPMKTYRSAFFVALAGKHPARRSTWLFLVALPFTRRGTKTSLMLPESIRSILPAALQPTVTNTELPPPVPPLSAEPELVPVQISPQRLQSIGVKHGRVQRKDIADGIRTAGNVAVDETRLSYVQVRFPGFIQKVFVDATYQYVRQGQPLFTIYSPDLVATEREDLVAKQNQKEVVHSTVPGVASGAASLLDAAVERLKQWQVPQSEIDRLEKTGEVGKEIEIDAPAAGYITERKAYPSTAVQPDMRLYAIADLSTVWVNAQVFQNDLGSVKVGAPATITADTYPGRAITGRVDFIYPDVDMATRTARVRIVLQNPDPPLSPGMFVKVALKVPMGDQLVVPASRRPAIRHPADCLCGPRKRVPGAARASAWHPRRRRLHRPKGLERASRS